MITTNLKVSLRETTIPLVAVDTPNEKSFFYKDPYSEMFYFERLNKATRKRTIIDVFGDFWSIAVAKNLPEGKVLLKTPSGWKPISHTDGLFVSPYSTLEWKIEDCEFNWNAVVITGKPPEFLPFNSSLFYSENFDLPLTSPDLMNSIRDLNFHTNVERFKPVSESVKFAKRFIDTQLGNEVAISTVAEESHLSQAQLSRLFKQSCGLSPVQYRNQMRIHKSLLLLLKGQRVSNVGHEVGFKDLARFNKQFKKIMEVVPSEFIP